MFICTECNQRVIENVPETYKNTKLWCDICSKATQWAELIKRKGIPDLLSSLDKIRELHLKKNEDYADANNAFSNFEFTEFVFCFFNNDRDKTYVWPIATKLARLGNLLSSNRNPNNESIEDSLLDIATYVLLWKADISRRTLNPTDQTSYQKQP